MIWRDATKEDGFEEPTKADYWIDLSKVDEDGIVWARASVKWDGCVDLDDFLDSEYTHICDLDRVIKDVTALREAALAHFGNEWDKQ